MLNKIEQDKVDRLTPRLRDFYKRGYDLAERGCAVNEVRPSRKDEREAFDMGLYHGTLSVQERYNRKCH